MRSGFRLCTIAFLEIDMAFSREKISMEFFMCTVDSQPDIESTKAQFSIWNNNNKKMWTTLTCSKISHKILGIFQIYRPVYWHICNYLFTTVFFSSSAKCTWHMQFDLRRLKKNKWFFLLVCSTHFFSFYLKENPNTILINRNTFRHQYWNEAIRMC